jgi:hypothetical protein
MDRYREQLAAAAGAVAFSKSGVLLWRGAAQPSLPRRALAALAPDGRRAYTSFLLRGKLYEGFYSHGGLPRGDAPSGEASTPAATASFLSALSNANAGAGSWERGWTWRRRGDGLCSVERAGLTLRAATGDVAAEPGGAVVAGAPVALRVPKDLPKISPGYYLARSNEDGAEVASPMVRLYWNLSPSGAVRLMRAVTTRLNDARIPFRIKALGDPAAYTRCDAAVLYFRRDDYAALTIHMTDIHQELRPFLKDPIPAFAKELAPGVGLAEDPGDGDSFGMSRCQLVAEGLLRAHEEGKSELADRIGAVEARFAGGGIDVTRPYLNPGSSDTYEFPLPRSALPGTERRGEDDGEELLPAELLRAATGIAKHLAERAIWIGDRVGWVGADTLPERDADGRGARSRALGPDLYAGTSGIALFLAESSAASGDSTVRRLALAAIDNALAGVESRAMSRGPGLFEGWSGAALVGARMGLLLGEPRLLSRARNLVRRWESDGGPCEPFDLLSGKAGVILALLILRDLLQDARLLHRAVRLGESLLGRAERGAGGISWRDPGDPILRALTGISHGAAGAAYSLLELFRATGEARFRDGAEAAFAYEQRWFTSEEGNWPDFRTAVGTAKRGPRGPAFASHWCHGAPGIALSRLRACEILGIEPYLEQARSALATTRREAERRLCTGAGDLSLCHGLAGDAEVLLCSASAPAPSTSPQDRKIAHRIARAIIRRLGSDGEEPDYLLESRPLGLMLGLAGVGHLFLRLRDERVPSVLMLRREEFSAPSYLAPGSNPSASQTSGC